MKTMRSKQQLNVRTNMRTLKSLVLLNKWDRNRGHAVGSLPIYAACAILLLLVITGIASASDTFKSLLSFNGTDGQTPISEALVQGRDGNLYGTTEFGGTQNGGTVFKITTAGALTTIYNFCSKTSCTDGRYPTESLVLGTNGNFYGGTSSGGAGFGTIFEITPEGVLNTLYSFCHSENCPDGFDPNGPLVLATDGNFYGTTVHGGVGGCGGCHGGGVAFKITPAGAYTKLHDFCTGTCTDGDDPSAGLIQGTDGSFYGTAISGGAHSAGTVFRMTTKGTVTTIYAFCAVTGCTDGINPVGSLVQGKDGNFYGTTDGDDSNGGNVFKVTPAGVLTSLHSFTTSTGAVPLAGVILAADGNFYGTTVTDFPDGNCCGSIFKITPAGTFTNLLTLNGTNGNGPYGLLQATEGAFFAATSSGGAKNLGTIFTLSTGLGPFAKLVTNTGKVGSTLEIVGEGFTGATAVSFNGVAATFDNVSNTYMTATVPAGALSGTVTVTTLSTSYHSSQVFRVTPQLSGFSPAGAAVGSSVTLTGVSLTQTTSVVIGGKTAAFKVVSDKQVSATVPAGAKTGEAIAITTAGGSVSFGSLKVLPKLASFTPASGAVGTEVTVNGTTFTGATGITFNGVAATSFEVINDSQLKAVVPTGATTGKLEITTPGGAATSSSNFTIP